MTCDFRISGGIARSSRVRIKTLVPVAALFCVLAACSRSEPPAAVAAEKSGSAGWGIDLSAMDTSIKPGDDFFRYVNGKWVERTEIPADKSSVGGLETMQDTALAEARAILEAAAADTTSPPNSELRKLGDWYASLMDEGAIESAGLAPIKPELDEINAVTDRSHLAALLAKNNGALGAKPITVSVDFDRTRVNNVIVGIDINRPSMGVRELYLDPAYAPVREQHLAHIERMFTAAGIENAKARAKNVQALETRIAKATWTAVELRDPLKKNNPMTVQELGRRAPGIDWPKFLSDAGVGAPAEVNMTTPSSVAEMAQLVANEPLPVWKDYLTYIGLAGNSTYLPKALRDETFAFFGKVLQGQQEPTPRWQAALLDVGWAGRPLSDPLSKAYVEKHVAANARLQARSMIDNLVAVFDERLTNLEWMAPETRAGAREKLAKLTIKPLYPDVWRDTSALEVTRGDPVGNARRGAALVQKMELDWLGQYPDRGLFFKPAFEANAYANPVWNEIVFEAAIMRPPNFDPDADPAVNYGAMGAIIGHEISHLFDDKGRSTDANGLLRDWWTARDAERFNEVANRLAEQVGSYEPIPGKRVDGQLTLGESIADVAGLVVAYDAYKRSLGGKEAPILDGFTGDQRFFMAFAQAWRWKGREAAIDRLMKTDPHPPGMVRPNTVRNLDAWYEAFDVQPGDALYLPPEQRVRLW